MAPQPSETVRNTADGEAAEASMAEVSEPSLQLTLRWSKGDSNFWSHLQREQPYAESFFCARLHRLRSF